jgi:hypothetical protein
MPATEITRCAASQARRRASVVGASVPGMGLLDALTITPVATLDGTVTYLDITIAGLPGWRGVLAADAVRELRDALNTLLPPDGLSREQAAALAATARAEAIARGDHEEIQLGLDGDKPFLALPYVLDAIQRASRPRLPRLPDPAPAADAAEWDTAGAVVEAMLGIDSGPHATPNTRGRSDSARRDHGCWSNRSLTVLFAPAPVICVVAPVRR